MKTSPKLSQNYHKISTKLSQNYHKSVVLAQPLASVSWRLICSVNVAPPSDAKGAGPSVTMLLQCWLSALGVGMKRKLPTSSCALLELDPLPPLETSFPTNDNNRRINFGNLHSSIELAHHSIGNDNIIQYKYLHVSLLPSMHGCLYRLALNVHHTSSRDEKKETINCHLNWN